MERIPGQAEQPTRNLRDEPMLTVEAMAQVEGPAWLEEQERIARGGVSEGERDGSLEHALELLQAGRSAKIQGRGGINRWFVEKDGSVAFSESHSESREHTEKARSLGFAIVP